MKRENLLCAQVTSLVTLLLCVATMATAQTAQGDAVRLQSRIQELEAEGLRLLQLEKSPGSTSERLERRIAREAQYKQAADYLESYLELFEVASREYVELLFRLGVLHHFAGDESEALEVLVRCKVHPEVREGRASYQGKQIRELLRPLEEEDIRRLRQANEEIRTIKKEFNLQRVIGDRPPRR